MTAALSRAYEVVRFWHDAGPKRWFSKSDAFDAAFRARFLATHEAAAAGRPSAWADSAEGALALVLLLDQFPRNTFRGGARMFATDAQARAVASAATDVSFELQVDAALRPFFYMPFMHSELLGRASTPEEQRFLAKGGFAG